MYKIMKQYKLNPPMWTRISGFHQQNYNIKQKNTAVNNIVWCNVSTPHAKRYG